MATNYPSTLDNSTSLPYPSATSDTNSPSLASGQSNQNDALIAVETKLGTGSSTATSGKLLAGTGSGTSSWSVAYPTGTIVGTSDTQTLTNKTISASSNTISGLQGSNLSNNSVTATQIANNTITATQIANATITDTQIASGTIDYANLLSTIFSGQISTQTNAGSAGGTFSYVNIGGIKVLWCVSSPQTLANATQAGYVFTLPTFFSSIGVAVPFFADATYFIGSTIANNGYASTTTVNVGVGNNSGGSQTYAIGILVIGT